VDDFRANLGTAVELTGRREEQLHKLLRLLRERGAPELCHVVAQDDEVDGRNLRLLDAVEACIDDGAALLICIPGRLALHFPEPPESPVLLESR
jgi:hypothetical protein